MDEKMALNTYLSTIKSKNKKKKKIKRAEQRQTHRYREHFNGFQIGEALGGRVKRGKGLGSTNWLLQNCHRGVRYRMGNIVYNVKAIYGVRWLLDLLE